MINTVNLIGRIVRDIEQKVTTSGKTCTTFTLAVQRDLKNSDGTYTSDFINCQAWGKLVETLAKYTQKGSLLAVLGRLQTRKYNNKNNQEVYVTEVVVNSIQFLEKKQTQQANYQIIEDDFGENNNPPFKPSVEINSDDLPF